MPTSTPNCYTNACQHCTLISAMQHTACLNAVQKYEKETQKGGRQNLMLSVYGKNFYSLKKQCICKQKAGVGRHEKKKTVLISLLYNQNLQELFWKINEEKQNSKPRSGRCMIYIAAFALFTLIRRENIHFYLSPIMAALNIN